MTWTKEDQRRYTKINKNQIRESHRLWKLNNPKKARMKNIRAWLKRYGLTWESYKEMWVKQNGLCIICNTNIQLADADSRADRNLKGKAIIDHNHLTGKIRGLLCCSCNLGIGFIEKMSNWIDKAQRYLREH